MTSTLITVTKGLGIASQWDTSNKLKRDFDQGKIYNSKSYLIGFEALAIALWPIFASHTLIATYCLRVIRLLFIYAIHKEDSKALNIIDKISIIFGAYMIRHMLCMVFGENTNNQDKFITNSLDYVVKSLNIKTSLGSKPTLRKRFSFYAAKCFNITTYPLVKVYALSKYLVSKALFATNKVLNTVLRVFDILIGARIKKFKTLAQPTVNLITTAYILTDLYFNPTSITVNAAALAVTAVFQLRDMGYTTSKINEYIDMVKRSGNIIETLTMLSQSVMRKIQSIYLLTLNGFGMLNSMWSGLGIYYNKLFAYLFSSEYFRFSEFKQQQAITKQEGIEKSQKKNLAKYAESKYILMRKIYHPLLKTYYSVKGMWHNTMFWLKTTGDMYRRLIKATESVAKPLHLEMPKNETQHLNHWNQEITQKFLGIDDQGNFTDNCNLTMSQTVFDKHTENLPSTELLIQQITKHSQTITSSDWKKYGIGNIITEEHGSEKKEYQINQENAHIAYDEFKDKIKCGDSLAERQIRSILDEFVKKLNTLSLSKDEASKATYYNKLKDFHQFIPVCLTGIAANLTTSLKLEGEGPKNSYYMLRQAQITSLESKFGQLSEHNSLTSLFLTAIRNYPFSTQYAVQMQTQIEVMCANSSSNDRGENETHTEMAKLTSTDPIVYKHIIQHDQNIRNITNSFGFILNNWNLGSLLFNLLPFNTVISETIVTPTIENHSERLYYFDNLRNEWANIMQRVYKVFTKDNAAFSEEAFEKLQADILNQAIDETLSIDKKTFEALARIKREVILESREKDLLPYKLDYYKITNDQLEVFEQAASDPNKINDELIKDIIEMIKKHINIDTKAFLTTYAKDVQKIGRNKAIVNLLASLRVHVNQTFKKLKVLKLGTDKSIQVHKDEIKKLEKDLPNKDLYATRNNYETILKQTKNYGLFSTVENSYYELDMTPEQQETLFRKAILPFVLIDLIDQDIILNINDNHEVVARPSQVTTPKPSTMRTMERWLTCSKHALIATARLSWDIAKIIPELTYELLIRWPIHILAIPMKKLRLTVPKLTHYLPAVLITPTPKKLSNTSSKPNKPKNQQRRNYYISRFLF